MRGEGCEWLGGARDETCTPARVRGWELVRARVCAVCGEHRACGPVGGLWFGRCLGGAWEVHVCVGGRRVGDGTGGDGMGWVEGGKRNRWGDACERMGL